MRVFVRVVQLAQMKEAIASREWDALVAPAGSMRALRMAGIGTIEPSPAVALSAYCCAGFRMPARRGLSTGAEGAGVGKPSGKEPAGAGCAGCRLWGFDGAASCVGAAMAWGSRRGRPTARERLSPLRLV